MAGTNTDHSDSASMLPLEFWSGSPTDMGFCQDHPPIMFNLADTHPPQDALSFIHRGHRFTELLQSFVMSPGLFNQALPLMLDDLQLPEGVVLVQYVNDLLLSVPLVQVCLEATRTLLLHLFNEGFKVFSVKSCSVVARQSHF